MIHPTAIVEPGAILGNDCEIHAHALISKHVVLGDGVVVHPFAVIGGDPQYLRFDRSTDSKVIVGKGSVLREHVTINRSIYAGQYTRLGEGCFLMAGAHVAHDCQLGDNVVMANQALLAGHVSVGSYSFIGGGAAMHQFVRVGESVMVGGHASITRDLAHYTLVAERDEVSGLNLVGLRRRGFARETIRELKEAFRDLYFTPGNIRDIARMLTESGRLVSAAAPRPLPFLTEGKRGFARSTRAPETTADDVS